MQKKKEENKETENKIGIKEKIKRFLKNKKAVAMLMEYIITIECFAMLFLLIAPEEVKAATLATDENGITWAYTLSNGKATNVYYQSGTLGETVTIPASLSDGTNEYPVVSLYYGFNSYNIFKTSSNTTVKKVNIPKGVTSIGSGAFYGCSSLTSVEIPSSVTSIGNYAFFKCSSLTSVEIPDSVTSIGSFIFSGCSSLTSVEIPEGVTNIYSAFSGCSSLTSVTIPSSVTSIGDSTFSGCSSLTSVVIPSSVTSMGYRAFEYCSSLTSIEIPSSVTIVGSQAFINCSNLKSVNILEGVTSIGSGAFYGCSSLTSVEIPSSVTSIGERAFFCCRSLTSVEIPSSVTSIGNDAFLGCSSLTSVVIEEGVKSIGGSTFSGCSSLTSVNIPSSVTSIAGSTFSGCSSLTSVNIPSSVTSIGDSAFSGCSSLTSVNIPSSVTSIEQSAFSRCSTLTNITVDVNNPNYSSENDILYNKEKTILVQCAAGKKGEVNIPSSVMSIEQSAFSGCSSLTSVEIPSSVTSIGDSAFKGCSSLTSVVVPEGVTRIETGVFRDCSSLTDIYIDNIELNMYKSGWAGYTNAHVHYSDCKHEMLITGSGIGTGLKIEVLSEDTIEGKIACGGTYQFKVVDESGNTVTNTDVKVETEGKFTNSSKVTEEILPNEAGIYTIENIKRNKRIILGTDNGTRFESVDENGITWSYTIGGNNKAINVYYVNGELGETVEIPASLDGYSVASLYNSSGGCIFTNSHSGRNRTVKKVIIPEGVTGIGWYAFAYCSSLTSIIIPDTVISIGDSVFYGCSSLTSVEIPSSVTSIENSAFYGCSSLSSIEIPSTVTRIGDYAFYDCSSLINVIIPDTVTSIGSYAFSGCSSLINVIIPNTVTSIGDYAFSGCSELTSMVLSEELTVIPSGFAANCSKLKQIKIPKKVKSIEGGYGYGAKGALVYCKEMTDVYIDNISENITLGTGYTNWNSGTYAYVHYSDCKHTVTKNIVEAGIQIEEVSNNLEEGQIACGETYQFKVIDENGNIPTGIKVSVTSEGQFTNSGVVTENIKPNEEGIYTIENIERNKTINIEKIVNGDTFQKTDENGITWEYTYQDGKARALKYISGEIPETLEVPATIDGLIVTTMADGALQGTNAKNVILPDSIINIGQNAFENCTNLETIVLPEGLQLISNSAFKGCSNLRQVELPDGLLVIGNEAFSGCTSLRMNLNFKEGIKAIGKESFKNCNSLTGRIILPGSTVTIGSGAFKGCTGITSVEILKYTGEEKLDERKVSFSNSSYYNSNINENGTNSYINDYTTNQNLSQGIMSNTSTIINNVKDENGNDVKDEFGNNVTEIFRITTVTRNVTIGGGAFNGCSSLTEIRLPAGVNKVAYSTIDGCDNLRDIYIATKKSDMLEEVNTNGEVKVHYLDCSHKVEVMPIEGTSIEVIAGETEEGLAACQGEYKFKVNIEEGSTLKGVVVKVGNVGEEKEAIKVDENGIYTIENVTKDKEISIEEGRIVEVRYEDKEGNQIAKSTILVGQEGENYKAERKEIANYRAYGEEPENKEGTFTKEEIVVTYKYEKIPSGTITIKYQDKEGNDIIDPETKQGYVGDEYEFVRKNIRGYKAYGVTPEKAKGRYTEEDIEIIFVYEEIKEEETVIKYIDKDGNYIARDKTIQEGEEASTEAKEIDGYESVEKIEEGKEITYTYEKADKTGQANKWTTEKTLMAIAGLIAILIVMFIIIAKREKEE